MRSTLLIASVLSLSFFGSTVALAGRGGSTLGIEAAVRSGSVDSIVGEVERAEALACLSCIAPVRLLVDYDSPQVREVAGWWLGRRGVRDELLADMKARLLAQDPVAARNAADVLRGMKDYTALPALMTYLANPLDEESGVAAARAIGAIGHPDGLAALKGALVSPLAGVRAAALSGWRNLRALPGSKTVSDASALMPLLTDADLSVRREAAYTAGYLLDKNAVGALSQVVTSDAAPAVRKAAAWALGQIGSGAAVGALTAATNDTDPLVRSVAMGALGRLK
jgi:HEAT repeat protein